MDITPTSFNLPNLLHLPPQSGVKARLAFLTRWQWTDWLSIGFTALGILAVSGGLLTLLVLPSTPISVPEVGDSDEVGIKGLGRLTVSVTGSVAQPGLYTLQEGDRVAQALEAAGGLLPEADGEQLSVLNLAQKVTDGQQLHIKKYQPVATSATVSTVIPTSSTTSTLININTASQKDLEILPGIGSVRAAAIIENRPYASPNDLLTKEVVTATMFTKLEALISI